MLFFKKGGGMERKLKGLWLFALAVVFSFTIALPAFARDTLGSGQTLYEGETLKSPNGQYKLILQNDGNLVLYDGSKAIWSTGTQRKQGRKLVMQSDGNLVLYGIRGPVWATNTSGNQGAYLKIQNDGNLVIYRAVWSIHTAR